MSNPNLNNRMSGGYNRGSDARLSQRPLPPVRPMQRPSHSSSNNIPMNNMARPMPNQRYSMQRPPPPPNHNNSQYQQPINMYNGRPPPPQHQRPMPNRQYQQRPPPANMMYQTGPYRRVSMNRSRSLSRPERQRPRQGMFRSPSQQRQLMMMNGGNRPLPPAPPGVNPRPPMQQPIPNRLQQQLNQHKIQKQAHIAGPVKKPLPKPVEEQEEKIEVLTSWWAWTAYLMTCCIPNWFLKVCLRKKNPMVQQAWREKLSLVYIIFLLCCALAFVTYGLNKTLCPTSGSNTPYSIMVNGKRVPAYNSNVRVFGQFYPMDVMKSFFAQHNMNFTNDYENTDISSIFNGDLNNDCAQFDRVQNTSTLKSCMLNDPYGGGLAAPNNTCLSLRQLQSFYKSKMGILGFAWEDMDLKSISGHGLTLVGDSVLNLTSYLNGGVAHFGLQVDSAIRTNLARDLSYALLYTQAGHQARKCMVARYKVGIMETETGGCIANQMIMTLILVVIIAMIIIRYSMALMFQWIIAGRLVKPGGRSNWLAWRSIKGGNNDPANHIPGPYNNYGNPAMGGSNASIGSTSSSRNTPTEVQSDIIKAQLYTVMLVTCYSEGEEGLRITMDSLARTTYSKKHKIFFVICDGLITGAGETRSTPDIVVNMMDLDPTMTNPKPATYLAIADGERQLNKAKVFAGHYKGVPCVTIVKCGTEEEVKTSKPGNRGKRDSQLILMSFFQRVLFNDRLSELDYEMFWKMTWLMKGVTPDKFETVLMVDADTKVLPDALTYMVAAMANDITIMGLCGETRIANKRSSWVTAIQVFEYYISHHYAKAFESLFGIVTCLPGCFSMYRIKTPKNGAWVPILANPDIILEYNQNVVTTLHEKNLLLLGEDRFLSTLMLRTFPRRQMMFVPQAKCKTVVPEDFKVLLSQRRRWINSTVHNLMELVLVSDLCGIACLSMQFSVFIDLIGTLVLPAAIVMTVYLIVDTAISTNPQWQSLALLIAILGLPAVLITITTFKLVYIMWMIVYIIALPVWNLVLPLYSFWHFDDFSWGATRVVAGEKKKDRGHLDAEGKFDPSRLVMKKWEDWEAERTGQRFNTNGSKMTLKTPVMLMDNTNESTKGSLNNTSSGSFGTMFNDRKMFGASPP